MELVRGVPITDYCDQARLTPRQRLELFLPVCRAIQHAHQKGIIHRDIKPSNLLVTLYDSHPVPKVIDFGIAKAVGPGFADHSVYTGFAQLVGTPMYMSPEQAEMTAQDVDTRADVYALGVVLYELLTGTTPFDGETLRLAGFDEMRRIIREDEPVRPSQRVTTLSAEKQTTVTGQRGVDSRQLGRQLRGDLDWVVMTCLAKDRTRRYESVGALAADIERYLRDEAVEACPPSTSYRVRTFARRHRRMLATVGVIAVALVTATAVSVWQAVAARDAQHRAEGAEQKAVTEAAVAKAVSDFLQTDLLKLADRKVQTEYGFVANPNLTVREALHRAAATVEQRFRDQPLVEAGIRATIGDAYLGVGENEIGETHLLRSLALFEAHREPDHPQVLAAVDRLALAYGLKQKWLTAIALRERAVAVTSASHGTDHPTTLATMDELSAAYVNAGRHSEGIRLKETIIAKRRATLGPDNPLTELDVYELANFLRHAGRWNESVAILEPLVEKAKAERGPDHMTSVNRTDALARAYIHVGRWDEAVLMLAKVLDVRRKRLGPEDGLTNHSLICLTRAYWAAGLPDKADDLLREAVRVSHTYEGAQGAIIHSHNQWHLAHNLLLQQRYTEAEAVAREALTAYEKYQPDYWMKFYTASLVGGALLGQGKHAAAEPFLIQGYQGLREREVTIFRPNFDRLRDAGERLARLYDETGRPEMARAIRKGIPTLQ